MNAKPLDLMPVPASLVHPVKRLVEELDALVQSGELQGAELDLTRPEMPCFLLDVAAGEPQFYVEL